MLHAWLASAMTAPTSVFGVRSCEFQHRTGSRFGMIQCCQNCPENLSLPSDELKISLMPIAGSK